MFLFLFVLLWLFHDKEAQDELKARHPEEVHAARKCLARKASRGRQRSRLAGPQRARCRYERNGRNHVRVAFIQKSACNNEDNKAINI